jgi:spermidine/putrescine transport system ATP-binding protein
MSGGQQQRVALARALVNRPAVLLLDEPLGALDRQLREEMQIELKLLQSHLGTTFVFVTHDQHEALSMGDRIAIMRSGRIEQLDTADEVYARPASAFVAGFVGQQNFIEGTLGGDGVVQAGPVRLRSTRPRPVGHPARPGRVRAAIRPEYVALGPAPAAGTDAGAPAENSVTGRLAGIAHLGETMQYVIEVPEATGTTSLISRIPTPAAPSVRPGETVIASWASDSVHLFTDDPPPSASADTEPVAS